VQTLAPALEVWPLGHALQVVEPVDPVDEVNVPGVHALQELVLALD